MEGKTPNTLASDLFSFLSLFTPLVFSASLIALSVSADFQISIFSLLAQRLWTPKIMFNCPIEIYIWLGN